MNKMQSLQNPMEVGDRTDMHNEGMIAELSALAAQLLETAKKEGADSAEVSVSDRTGLSVGARQRDVESVELNQDRSFGLSVYIDSRRGMASTSDMRSHAVMETVNKAINFARFTEPDPCNGLAEPELLAKDLPELDLYHPQPMETETLKELALRAEAAALDADDLIVNSHGSSAWFQSGCEVYANSYGFVGSSRGTQYGMSVAAIAADEGGMKTDSWYTISRVYDDLDSPESVGRAAAERTLLRLGARNVATGCYPVIFDAQMAQSVIGCLISALSGNLLYRNASFLTDSIGKQVAVSGLALRQQPHLKRAVGSCAFDGEGVATRDLVFVEDGVVTSYVLDSYTGRKLKMPTTGNAGGVFNLVLDAETKSRDELIKSIQSGFLVTELMGQGVNLVTGDFSRGAAGIWIENGCSAYAVDEVTIAGNLKDMFAGLVGFGDDVDVRGNFRTGSILVEGMTVASG